MVVVVVVLLARREPYLLTCCPWRRVTPSAVEDVAAEAARKITCRGPTTQARECVEEQTSHDTTQRRLRAAWQRAPGPPRGASPAVVRLRADLTVGSHTQTCRDWQRSAGSRQPAGPIDQGCCSRYFLRLLSFSFMVYHHVEEAHVRPFFLCQLAVRLFPLIMLRQPSQQGDVSPKFIILVSHKAVKRRPNTSS